MSTYNFAGVHPTAEEIATAAMDAHPNTPVRIYAGTRYEVALQYIDTTAAQVTVYAAVSDGRDFPLETLQEQLTEAGESLESARKEAVRLAGPTTLTDKGDEGDGDLSVTVRVETARIQEDLGNLRDTLNALRSLTAITAAAVGLELRQLRRDLRSVYRRIDALEDREFARRLARGSEGAQ